MTLSPLVTETLLFTLRNEGPLLVRPPFCKKIDPPSVAQALLPAHLRFRPGQKRPPCSFRSFRTEYSQ